MSNQSSEVARKHQQRELWAQLPPLALVGEAREKLYKEFADRPEITGPIEEVIGRFEQATKAQAGSVTATSGMGVS